MTASNTNIFEEKKLGQAQDFGLLKKLTPYVKPYRVLFTYTFILIILITGLELTIPYITKVAIDRYIVPENSIRLKKGAQMRFLRCDLSDPEVSRIVAAYPDLFQVNKNSAIISYKQLPDLPKNAIFQLRKNDLTGVSHAAAWLLIIVIIGFFLNFIKVILMEYAGQKMMHDLRIKLFSHIQRLSIHFFTKNPVGRLVTRVTNDTQNMQEMFTSVLVFVVKDVFMLIGITVVLFSIDWQLSVAVYTVFPFVFYASYKFSRSARQAFRTLRIKVAEINSKFSETIGGMQVIQLFRQENANYKKFKKINNAHFQAGMQQITVFALFMPLIEMMSSVALAIVIFYGGESIIAQRISLGTLVVFISYIKMFFRPIRDIAEKYNITLNALSSAERMFLILEDSDMLPETGEKKLAQAPARLKSLGFNHVHFSYVKGEIVLDDISFDIRAGETIAIVGPTGAGKTSIVNLITRFYDPDSGSVMINGTDIRQFKISDLRSKVAVVTQDPYIFSGSIRNNIFTQKDPIRDRKINDINDILEASYCKSFIDKLPNGIDTELTESGASLSSGERQLISIARALAHNPDLIIFDEATSYVDSETESKISEALSNLMKNRTSVIIAHRLSTSRVADRIMVIHSGKILETGTHEELLKQKGFYHRLNLMQG
ncbi:MAG: ABC transporter ATP-binding protein [Desulfobacteraceae bacterium]|nr:ABC transporter ATP-binding protein [Desulfobacteraceae bacterium]MBC2755997.1 ABC transporter ATP-binding protein [Desulfobacteraceae bacterium]